MLFTPEELKAMKPKEFFEDGIAKEIVIIEKIDKISKIGTPFYTFEISTTDGKEQKVITDFGFSEELIKLNDQIEKGHTVISVLPIKTGEREYNGKTYSEFSYQMSISGKIESIAAPAISNDGEIDLDQVKF